MLFNSVEFAFFLPLVFVIYCFVVNKNIQAQNVFLIIASYFFYGWWDWRFLLSLIFFSSTVDYLVGIWLTKYEKKNIRTMLLLTSIFVNIGFLVFFKYFNFFAESFSDAYSLFGKHIEASRLNIVLPVGISFYTFQTLSYTIDVYRRKLKPTKNAFAFYAYVSFFPQLVAGPIERATNLLPQFYTKRVFRYSNAADGMRQILWGLFKKIVIADNCARFVEDIFANYNQYTGSTLLLGAILFAFQIYCDFSGYSDIAIGTARLVGFQLMRNFAYPYFSRDIAEFWRRWHISLSTWFRDYVYIPLGGSRGNRWKQVRNTFLIFIVSGFWHGAKWTFIVWGVLNACYFLPLLLLKQNRKNLQIVARKSWLPSVKETFQIIATFLLTTLAWIFFRAENISHAFAFIHRLFGTALFSVPEILPIKTIAFIFILIIVEWLQRKKQHALQFGSLNMPLLLRWSIYYVIIVFIILFGGSGQEFIYFQF